MSHVDEGALHAYLDGELTPAERAALETHVAECPTCRARLAEEQALLERAGQLLGLVQPVERPAPPLNQLRPRIVWRLRVPLAWAASVVLALVVGYNLRSSTAPFPASSLADSNVLGYSDQAAEPRAEERLAAPSARQNRRAEAPTELTSVDSYAAPPPAVGVIAIQPAAPGVRNAAPVRQQADSIAGLEVARDVRVDGAAASGVVQIRGRDVATTWPIIRRGSARSLLGADPVGVPGLPVRDIRRSPSGDGTVLVEQVIDSNTVIHVFQRSATLNRLYSADSTRSMRFSERAAAPAAKAAEADRLARFVGGLRVEIAGPLSQDSLNRLLELVKPLP